MHVYYHKLFTVILNLTAQLPDTNLSPCVNLLMYEV